MKHGIIIVFKVDSKFNVGKAKGALKISELTLVSVLIALCVLAYLIL